MLHQLRGLGVRISMDDFGTGYSSLGYLQRFPFDKIKIDRSLHQRHGRADGRPAIVRAVAAIAARPGMTTTAEGVETETAADAARAGCTRDAGLPVQHGAAGGRDQAHADA